MDACDDLEVFNQLLLTGVGRTGIDDDAGTSFVGGRWRSGDWMVLLPNNVVNVGSVDGVEGLVHLCKDITGVIACCIKGVKVTCCREV